MTAPLIIPGSVAAVSQEMSIHKITLRNYVELAVNPVSVSLGRRHARLVLRSWGRRDLTDVVELVVSELVTNALVATEKVAGLRTGWDRSVWLGLHRFRGDVVVEVWDHSRDVPKLIDAGPQEISGRGLQLVDQLAAAWGFRWPVTGGKVVWARLDGSL
jgi:hypothetical protein